MTTDPIPLHQDEGDRLFIQYRMTVHKHGRDSRQARDAWTDYIMDFIPAEDRPFATQVLMERMGWEA